ncbi:unnamed protein product [Ranitomeya imitator]|uniref:Uncharacterized protein n=1 Tax=Ranitomeya imitator TaxID=111125 RepID=A0ABN9M8J3_9NEOB|nr:unnamed protein product [Ranitomeya imitator]
MQGLRDSRATLTLVKPHLFWDQEKTDRTVAVRVAGGAIHRLPTARIHLNWGVGNGLVEDSCPWGLIPSLRGVVVGSEKKRYRSSNLLDSGMLVNIQSSGIKTEPMLITHEKMSITSIVEKCEVSGIRDCVTYQCDGNPRKSAANNTLTAREVEACQGDLSTLANVVTSLANFSKSNELSQSSTELSIVEGLSNGDTSLSEIPQDNQSNNEVTRAFDTLAKALNPSESSSQDSTENIDSSSSLFQEIGVVEMEGPLLSDSHIAFKGPKVIGQWTLRAAINSEGVSLVNL